MVKIASISVADKTTTELSDSLLAYNFPLGEIVMLHIDDGKWGKKFLRPESNCQKTITDSRPPEMI
jgi:hypothetical protein